MAPQILLLQVADLLLMSACISETHGDHPIMIRHFLSVWDTDGETSVLAILIMVILLGDFHIMAIIPTIPGTGIIPTGEEVISGTIIMIGTEITDIITD